MVYERNYYYFIFFVHEKKHNIAINNKGRMTNIIPSYPVFIELKSGHVTSSNRNLYKYTHTYFITHADPLCKNDAKGLLISFLHRLSKRFTFVTLLYIGTSMSHGEQKENRNVEEFFK